MKARACAPFRGARALGAIYHAVVLLVLLLAADDTTLCQIGVCALRAHSTLTEGDISPATGGPPLLPVLYMCVCVCGEER